MMIEIVHADSADTLLLSEIERACFSHPLTEPQLERLLCDENTIFLAAYESSSPDRSAFPIASLWAQTVLDEGYIGNVAVLSAYRRRGAASALLLELERLAREKELAFLTLEVRAGNAPAIALYEKHGYARAGLRRGYYTDPKEDAVLMTKILKQENT